jgi:hypothetical protein
LPSRYRDSENLAIWVAKLLQWQLRVKQAARLLQVFPYQLRVLIVNALLPLSNAERAVGKSMKDEKIDHKP